MIFKILYHFFRVYGHDYYGERIGVLFAWDLANAFASVHDEWAEWETY